jgi:hypothetical protein
MINTEILKSTDFLSGFIKIHKINRTTGEACLLIDKKNLILKGGAKIIAQALGGIANSNIWGMYIGYNNDSEFNINEDAPSIDVDYTNKFSNYTTENNFGYLREQLTFSPSFLSSSGYDENTVMFSTMVTSASSAGGAVFSEDSQIFEVALVAAQNPLDASKDTVFSRTNFNPVKYDANYNFTITWGVRILIPTT